MSSEHCLHGEASIIYEPHSSVFYSVLNPILEPNVNNWKSLNCQEVWGYPPINFSVVLMLMFASEKCIKVIKHF